MPRERIAPANERRRDVLQRRARLANNRLNELRGSIEIGATCKKTLCFAFNLTCYPNTRARGLSKF